MVASSNFSREISRLNWTHMTYQVLTENTSRIPLNVYRRLQPNSNVTTAAQLIIKDPSTMTTQTGPKSTNRKPLSRPISPTL